MSILVLLRHAGMSSRLRERSGILPLRSPAGTLSHPDAGTSKSLSPPGGTTPSTVTRRLALWPTSARWTGELLETRDARQGMGKSHARPKLAAEGNEFNAFRWIQRLWGRRRCGISPATAENSAPEPNASTKGRFVT